LRHAQFLGILVLEHFVHQKLELRVPRAFHFFFERRNFGFEQQFLVLHEFPLEILERGFLLPQPKLFTAKLLPVIPELLLILTSLNLNFTATLLQLYTQPTQFPL
jgi:hypothetical protein